MSEKAKLYLSRGIKIVCILLGLLFFVPAFTVSCSSQSIDVSPVHSIFGYYSTSGYSGEREVISNPAPWVIVLIIIPIIVFILWLHFSDSIKKHFWVYIASAGGVLVDFLMWGVFKNKVYAVAAENYADVEEQFGYTYSMVLLVVLAVLVAIHAILVFIPSSSGQKNNVEDAE